MSLVSKLFQVGGNFLTKTLPGAGKSIWSETQKVAAVAKNIEYKSIGDAFKNTWSYKHATSLGRNINETITANPKLGKTLKAATFLGKWSIQGLPRAAMRFPKTAAGASLLAGTAFGSVSYGIQRSDERTRQMAQRGMQGNNLGTDGLTLALNRRRHS